MSTIWLVILISIAIIAFFMIGLSLTLIFKGHNLESEVGDNRHMKKMGIKCTSQQLREEERALRGEDCGSLTDCSPDGCGSCGFGKIDE